jgi:hypothetical protein
VVEGRAAAGRLAELQADVWIPDDAAWASTAEDKLLARPGVAGSGTVLATSPIYMVASAPTARTVQQAGGSWLALARMLTNGSGTRLSVRDPAGSGDGMVAAGSLAEAVWVKDGMDASSVALINALRVTRTVRDPGPALPAQAREVGLVPEYALLSGKVPQRQELTILGPTDHTALLRFTRLPTAFGYVRPGGAEALDRLLAALRGPESRPAFAVANLRPPDAAEAPTGATGHMPKPAAKPFEVLGGHHVGHVFSAFYPADRRTSLLVVVDVSGSMRAKPDRRRQLIDLVRDGCGSVGNLLPHDAYLGLWEFGSRLEGMRDHRALLPLAELTGAHRRRLQAAIGRLTARDTGTGLHDTIVAAYQAATRSYRPGIVNQVLVFTDGKNQDDSPTITAGQMAGALKKAADPQRPVQLTIAGFGSAPEIGVLEKAVKDVDGYVEHGDEASEVAATFIHVAAGAGGH